MSSIGPILTTGVATPSGPNGAVPLRYEIRDLASKFPDQFNLFVLGLRAYQVQSKDSPVSYYQTAGIHGEPFKAYDNVQGILNPDFGGYCTHSSVLFAPWHRPYLALFEQSLYQAVQNVASQFPANLRDKYQAAAATFRLPYFDWASPLRQGASEFPDTLAQPQITVVDVDGQTKTIDSPLYSFNFAAVQPDSGDLTGNWVNYSTTVRYPDASGNSQDSLVSQVLTNESASRRENVAMLLLSPSYQDFDAFTNNAWQGPGNPGTYSSLEDVHNEIHDETGGGGHMSALEVAAFDPLFWVHHCNVDRLWAIWQDLNPTSLISPQQVQASNFYTPEGMTEDQNSLLLPFRDQTGTAFWSPTRVMQTETFGYAYPETQQWKFSSQSDYQQALRTSVNTLYGGNVLRNFVERIAPVAKTPTVAHPSDPTKPKGNIIDAAVSHIKKATADLTTSTHSTGAPTASGAPSTPPAHLLQHNLMALPAMAVQGADPSGTKPAEGHGHLPPSLGTIVAAKQYQSYVTNIRALKHGLHQTFRVIVFLGEFNKDPFSWHTEYNVVGRVTMLGRSPESECGRCHHDKARNLMATGSVPLTSALLQDIHAGKLRSLEPDDVVPYLAQHLHWRVTIFSGHEKTVSEVPGLKVSVASVKVTVGEDGLPSYSREFVTRPQATAGKPGGLNNADEV